MPSRTGALRGYLVGTLIAVALLMTLTTTGASGNEMGRLAHDEMGKLAQVYGAYTWAILLLVAALVVLLEKRCKLRLHRPEMPIAA